MILAMGSETVRTHYHYCSEHDYLFEAYKTKDQSDADPYKIIGPGMGILYKFRAGEWTKEYPMDVTCPQGNSDG